MAATAQLNKIEQIGNCLGRERGKIC